MSDRRPMPVFCFTIDMDWAPQAVIDDTLALLAAYDVPATLFLTNPLPTLDVGHHELALHPNFEQSSDPQRVLAELKAGAAPNAIGVRAHALHYNYRLLAPYDRLGLRYDSNVVMYNRPGIEPYRLTPAIWELPVFFMDYIHLVMQHGRAGAFAPESLDLAAPGMKVFDLHPHHVFLNTEDLARYDRAKASYHDPDGLRRHANPESSGTGIRVLLRRVLERVRAEGWPVETMSTVFDRAAAGSDR
jgi:hypothetical protein